ncbi:MAG: LlaJI family restriction endonuclease [Halanaerobiales bacterium]
MKMKYNQLRDRCFNEGVKYPKYQVNNIEEEIFERNICYRKNDEIVFNFVGFLIINNEVIIVFPKTYSIPDRNEELKKHIKLLAGVLLKYRNEGSLSEEEKELLGNPDKNKYANRIAAALLLIKDFRENGFVRREKKDNRINAGNNIDWARTVKEKPPYFSNNTPYYIDMIVRHSRIDYMNMLFLLHKYSVNMSFKKFGWILGEGNYKSNLGISKMPCDVYLADHILNKEMQKTFVHREINLIKSIREFILGSAEDEIKSKIDIFGTCYFHHIWEKMCGNIFNNEYTQLKKYIPRPVWRLSSNNSSTNYRNQIPDILFKDSIKSKLYILDAKYYNVNSSLPGWHDLVKQFYYYYSINQHSDILELENILVFPGIIRDGYIFKYYGFVEIENYSSLGRVDACILDIRVTMESYLNNIPIKDLREKLVKCISIHNNGV